MAVFTPHGEHCAAGGVTVSSAAYQSLVVAPVLTRLESRLQQSRQCCADWSAELSTTFPARALVGRRPRSLILRHITSRPFSLAASSWANSAQAGEHRLTYMVTVRHSAWLPAQWTGLYIVWLTFRRKPSEVVLDWSARRAEKMQLVTKVGGGPDSLGPLALRSWEGRVPRVP
jgi:hypothetical protein